jgi:uncharacterized membrane protein YedE/YeeE
MLRLVSLLSGMLFGAGLAVSGMINPHVVRGFLDVTGNWNPSLLLVMGGAVAVAAIAFRLSLRRERPLLGERYCLPDNTALDGRLLGGAAVFGVGWGIAGYCPGPAIAALATLGWQPLVLFLAMAAGSLLGRWQEFRLLPDSGRVDG